MGTSQSSGGPGGGVPMVPPWVPDIPAEPGDQDTPDQPVVPVARPVLMAPAGRFGNARRGLGEFAGSGDREGLRRALGHYVRTGYGGRGGLVRRLGGTAATADSLYQVLSGGAAGREPGVAIDRALLAGRDAREIIDALVEAVRPIDGTQDAESAREAMRDALAELLTQFPEADLLGLSAEERAFVIERFVAIDICRRFELDIGKTVLEKAPTASAALSRLKDIRSYIKEAVALSFRRLSDRGISLTAATVTRVVRDAMSDTFAVFEGYLA